MIKNISEKMYLAIFCYTCTKCFITEHYICYSKYTQIQTISISFI